MKKSVLFAFGAIPPLVATAVLAIIMPPLGTWCIVAGIAMVTGGFSAWAGHERNQLLVSVREQIDKGTQTTLKALEKAREETKTARSEADKVLAERLERFFKEYGEREKEWRTKTLADWRKATSEVQEVVRQTCKEFEQLSEITKNAVEQHAQTTTEAMSHVEDHLDKQRKNEVESRQAALADWQEVTKELGLSFAEMLSSIRSHLETIANEERELQERSTKSRAKAIDAELARVRETFELAVQGIGNALDGLDSTVEDSRSKLNMEVEKAIEGLRQLIEEEMRRQQEQKRKDRDHYEKMLEIQQEAHIEASSRSEKLWGHLLDQLEK